MNIITFFFVQRISSSSISIIIECTIKEYKFMVRVGLEKCSPSLLPSTEKMIFIILTFT